MTYPEGRQPLSWDDVMGVKHVSHPSTWQQECETLRRDYSLMQIDRNNLRSLLDATEAKVDELHDKLDHAQAEAKALRAENTDLTLRVIAIEEEANIAQEARMIAEARVQELDCDNGRLRTALEWYRDQHRISSKPTIDAEWAATRLKTDGGARADAALQKQEGE